MDITQCGAQVPNDTLNKLQLLLNIFLCAVISGFSCKVDQSGSWGK